MGALTAFVVGPPVLLYRFGGSPLPHRLAGWHQVMAALFSRDDGRLALAAVRDGTWLAWLLFTTCVLAEAVAALRGRRAPRLRLGGIQGVAARLVALAAVAVSTLTASTVAASAATVTGQLASQVQSGPAQTGRAPFAAVLDSVTVSSAPTVTVRSGDCLWSLAQRYLGAGDLYPEIARLNYGRQMGGGQVFTSPALIMPGWQLLLPANGTADGDGQPAALPSVSHHSGHPTADVIYQRRHPTARFASPAVQASNPTVRNGGVGLGSGSSAIAARAQPPTVSREDGQADSVPQAATFVTGALAGAVVTSLTRLRFRQRQERRSGRRIALPASTAVLATEQRLRATTPASSLRSLRDALAILEADALTSRAGLPDIIGVHVAPGVLEVLLATPAAEAPPAPFEVSPGRQGMCWQLALPAIGAPPMREEECHVLPGLITVGATGDGYLLLDLEALQVTGCDGPQSLVDQVVTTIATELAVGQWSGWYDLVLVGCAELEPLGRADHYPSLEEALSNLVSRCARTAQHIASRAPADVRELRLAEPEDEDWGLMILVSRVEPTPDQLTRLLDLAVDSGSGVAVLFAGDPQTQDGRMAPAAMQLAPDPHAADGILANVVPLQITVRPRALSPAEYAAIGTLFTTAAGLQDVATHDQPYTVYSAPPWIPQAASRADPDVAELPGLAAADAWLRHGAAPVSVEPDAAEADGWLWGGADPAGAVPDAAEADGWLWGGADPATVEPEAAEADGWLPHGADSVSAAPGADERDAWLQRSAETVRVDPHSAEAHAWLPDGQDPAGSVPDSDGADGRLSRGAHPVRTDPLSSDPVSDELGECEPSTDEPAAQALNVSVLGPLVISGPSGPLQPKQAELVLALALAAPAGLSNSALCAMLGADPDHPKPTDAVRQIIARTRRRLGRATDGAEYIIHTGSGRYSLHPEVSLDWSRFRELVASPRADDLRAALALVRGEPFSGGYFWWIDIPLIESVRAEVVDAAERLAEMELAADLPRAAARAAWSGLLAESSAEQLWRAVMRAEHAAGNLAGATEAWRRCLDAIEDVAPGGEPHPETVALYRSLTAGEPVSSR